MRKWDVTKTPALGRKGRKENACHDISYDDGKSPLRRIILGSIAAIRKKKYRVHSHVLHVLSQSRRIDLSDILSFVYRAFKSRVALLVVCRTGTKRNETSLTWASNSMLV
jgi:hypothetical protein